MTVPAATGDFGLGWQVDGDELVLVVSAASAGLRRELGPTAWSVLESLVLAARPTVVGELVARANAREIAAAAGVGRDAATKALALLRDRGLIVMEQPRSNGGQFHAARYVIRVERLGEAPPTKRRAHTISARERVATPTLFGPPTSDTRNPDDDDPSPDARLSSDRVTKNATGHNPLSPPDSRKEPHTLALSMRTDHDPGGGGGC